MAQWCGAAHRQGPAPLPCWTGLLLSGTAAPLQYTTPGLPPGLQDGSPGQQPPALQHHAPHLQPRLIVDEVPTPQPVTVGAQLLGAPLLFAELAGMNEEEQVQEDVTVAALSAAQPGTKRLGPPSHWGSLPLLPMPHCLCWW